MMNRDEAYIFDRDRNEEITKDVSSITVAGNGGYLITFNNGSKSYPYKKDRILKSANLGLIRIKTTQVDVEKKIKDALRHQA